MNHKNTMAFRRALFIISFIIAIAGFIVFKHWQYGSMQSLGFYSMLSGISITLLIMVYEGKGAATFEIRGIFILAALFLLAHIIPIEPLVSLGMLTLGIIPVLYSIRFFRKKNRGRLDYIKYVWVLTAFPGELSLFYSYEPGRLLYYASLIILPFMLLDFILFAPHIGFLWKKKTEVVE